MTVANGTESLVDWNDRGEVGDAVFLACRTGKRSGFRVDALGNACMRNALRCECGHRCRC